MNIASEMTNKFYTTDLRTPAPDERSYDNALLEVQNLQTHLFLMEGVAKAVDGVSFTIHEQQTVGLVGESGCGKTMTALSILRLIPDPPAKIVGGRILLHNTDLLKLPRSAMRKIRGNKISMIFQEPMSALNPLYTIGNQIVEVLKLHRNMTKQEANAEALRLLDLVKIPSPSQRLREYPHQLSGGMRQRAMIAMALACHPELLIADEPTTALDVTVQAQILQLLEELQQQIQMAILLITHNFGVIAELATEVIVMYAGMIVEQASSSELFTQPIHPYTRALLSSLPNIEHINQRDRLTTIEGTVPDPLAFPRGCRFHPRCAMKTDECLSEIPQLIEIAPRHLVRCIRWDKI
ncbi:MAG: ABC transporter ATP-binding protein [Candidatus Sumerlaeia bacterium]|nr:ABC transporter ATP-binding protein [Candidatus Sumerlaeia bacterium]